MLLAPIPCGFGLFIDSRTGQPDSGSSVGASITGDASANTMSSWQDFILSTSDDAYGIHIALHLPNTAGSSRAGIADVGVKYVGDPGYTVLIPSLLFHAAGPRSAQGAHQFFFPLFIKAGADIGIRFQSSTGGLTAKARVQLLCRPDRPDAWRTGTFVRAFGVDTATTAGTTMTEGTTSEGAWTQLGSNTVEPLWFWNVGIGGPLGTIFGTTAHYDLGLGDSTNKDVIIRNETVGGQISESFMRASHQTAVAPAPAGTGVYARCQAETGMTPYIAAYGLG
jgi:hypothetical protein